MPTSRRRSRRSSGSPPVSRILRTPRSTDSRARRVISSKVSSSVAGQEPEGLARYTSRGMQ